MAFLQIYRELLSLATFLQVHSNSDKLPYLSWQNMYPNLKTSSHIKPKFFLWTKLLENLLHAKYLTSVAATLNIYYVYIWAIVFLGCHASIRVWTKERRN